MAERTLTREEALAAIREVTEIFDREENIAKMQRAKEEAGNDFMKMMAIVVPVAIEMQKPVAEKYGFEPTQQGMTRFTMEIKKYVGTSDDDELTRLYNNLVRRYMPTF